MVDKESSKLGTWVYGVGGTVVGGILVYLFTQVPIGKPYVSIIHLYNLDQRYSITQKNSDEIYIIEKTYFLKTGGWGTIRDVEIIIDEENPIIETYPNIYFTKNNKDDGTTAISFGAVESGSDYKLTIRTVGNGMSIGSAEAKAIYSSNASAYMDDKRGGIEGALFDYWWALIGAYVLGIMSLLGVLASETGGTPAKQNGSGDKKDG